MVRLGVLEGQGEGLLKSPKPNSSYFARSDAALREWSGQVLSALKRSPDSAYTLVLKIFHSEIANHLVQSGEFPSRPATKDLTNGPPAPHRKHRNQSPDVSDSEDERERIRRRN